MSTYTIQVTGTVTATAEHPPADKLTAEERAFLGIPEEGPK